MIRLADAQPIANGSFRRCYVHPSEPDKCIKIALPRPPDYRIGVVGRLLRVRAKHPNLREWEEYQRLRARGVPLERYFPTVHDIVETDLGPGLVVDLVRGIDGALPVSVQAYMRGVRPEGLTPETVIVELVRFAAFCTRYAIFASCDEPGNVGFVRERSGFRFVAFDLKLRHNKEFIPIATVMAAARRRKVARRFAATVKQVTAALGRA